jgi:cytochrome c biogenesis protein CcmG, thiol:disulfide interchange protein DsbE
MRGLGATISVALLVATVTGAARPVAASSVEVARACTPAVHGNGAATGDAAPTFTLPTLDHRCVRLAALRGSPVVVNFWASWCHPCRQEFPDLRAAYAEHHAAGLEIVGVTYRDIRSDSRQFAREQHADWILASDDDGDVAKAYGVKPVPQTIFIRPDGTIAAHIYGPVSKRELAKQLRTILPAPTTSSSSPETASG